jgi:hypothetical protein
MTRLAGSLERQELALSQHAPQETYRAVSSLAVVSLLLGLISVVAIFDWSMAVVPLAGVLASLRAWRSIVRRSDELTGKALAQTGLALSVIFWGGGWAWLSFEYATEVPAGYERLTFAELQPDPASPEQLIPPEASAFDGKKVFMKGFVLPGRQTSGITEFLLVWNSGDCCFGGNPPLTHMVAVTLLEPLRMTYSTKQRKVAGTFHVDPGAAAEGHSVVYKLDAEYLQ